MKTSLMVTLLALGCATGRGGGERSGGPVTAHFAAASRAYSQSRQRQEASTGCGLLTAVRSLTTAQDCLGCHDAVLQPVHVQHAYWVDYEAARAARPLRPAADLPAAIVLVDNVTLSCTSCHDGASRYPSHTALPLDRSALCVGCHTT